MAQSLFMLLKLQRPSTHISVFAPPWNKPLLQRMPEVDASFELPFRHGQLKLRSRRLFGRALKGEGYTQAIVLPNSFKSALIPWFANIPLRTGWRGEARAGLLNDSRQLDKQKYPLMVQRFAALAIPAGGPLPQKLPFPRLLVQSELVDAAVHRFGFSDYSRSSTRLLAVCPGAAYGPSKQWPAERFASACANLIGMGWQVALMGSAADISFAKQIETSIADKIGSRVIDKCFNLVGKTRLEESTDLLSACSAVLANDSGLMHIAAALGVPVVALYGPTPSDLYPPLAPLFRALESDVACRPCFDRKCRFGHGDCMSNIGANEAVHAVLELSRRGDV